eukprot:2148080-Pyramimonas_sp.AAC.1
MHLSGYFTRVRFCVNEPPAESGGGRTAFTLDPGRREAERTQAQELTCYKRVLGRRARSWVPA